jgi:hypothetical protein
MLETPRVFKGIVGNSQSFQRDCWKLAEFSKGLLETRREFSIIPPFPHVWSTPDSICDMKLRVLYLVTGQQIAKRSE